MAMKPWTEAKSSRNLMSGVTLYESPSVGIKLCVGGPTQAPQSLRDLELVAQVWARGTEHKFTCSLIESRAMGQPAVTLDKSWSRLQDSDKLVLRVLGAAKEWM